MSEAGKTQQARRALATRKAAMYSERDDLAAVAITGSVARGQLWVGSDVDLWGFSYSGQEAFEDGVEVVDGQEIYWEEVRQRRVLRQTDVLLDLCAVAN